MPDGLQRYRIRVGCHLDDRWTARFDGLSVTNLPEGEAILETQMIDQSALHGLLGQIRDLNIRLISVQREEDQK